MKARTILAGFGAGVFFTLPYTVFLLSPDHLLLYHSHLPLHSVAGAILVDFAILWGIGASLAAYLEKPRAGNLHWAWIGISVLAAVTVAVVVTGILQPLSRDRYAIGAALAALISPLAFRWLWPGIYRGYARALMTMFLLAGFAAVWVLPELGWLAVAPARRAEADPPHRAAKMKQARIVWLLFDELSYDQTFEHRSPSVKMPSFDELERSSVVFSDLQPVAYVTQLAIPSFFLGERAVDLESNMEGIPRFRLAGKKGWHDFDAENTIFGAARKLGWSTGAVGWYNPACRILEGALDYCYTVANDLELGGMSSKNSVLQNVMLPIQSRLARVVPVRKPPTPSGEHEIAFRAIMRRARFLLADENIRFVFIHLPIPHPPGIYDRKTGKLRAGGDYLDNLALSDRTLGELLRILSQTASAKRTTLVVCSDHSWRVPMWKGYGMMDAEETAASGGVFDPRPVLMIRFPKQPSGIMISAPVSELRLHGILLNMLRGQMTTQTDLVDWLRNGLESPENVSSPSSPPESQR